MFTVFTFNMQQQLDFIVLCKYCIHLFACSFAVYLMTQVAATVCYSMM